MKMKFTLAEILLMCLITGSLFSQNYNHLSDYNSDGEVIYSKPIRLSRGVNVIKEVMYFLSSGLYFIEISNSELKYTKKVVVEK